jgi:hypothetical protein
MTLRKGTPELQPKRLVPCFLKLVGQKQLPPPAIEANFESHIPISPKALRYRAF